MFKHFVHSLIKLLFLVQNNDHYNKINDIGGHLLLTPLITNGYIDAAQKRSRVLIPGFEDVESYSGFITVEETNNGNLFFWFFKSKRTNAPLAVWLQGGPGASSLVGLFHENGPFEVHNNKIRRRKYSWSNMFNLIYIDSPVGTGFSFTDSENGYTRNQSQITDHLYAFLQQFLTMFPEQRNNDLYLMGESYGCKSVVDLGHRIHSTQNSKINLKGLAIGGGFCDPPTQSKYGLFLYNKWLIDKKLLRKFLSREDYLQDLLEQNKFSKATHVFQSLVRLNKSINFYNYEDKYSGQDVYDFAFVISERRFKSALHVGNVRFNIQNSVSEHLREDFMKSVKTKFRTLFENYKVLLFNGDLDVICAVPMMDQLIDSIQWNGAGNYRSTANQDLLIGTNVIGYTRKYHNLSRAVIFNAGHLTPHDQSIASYLLIKHFVFS